MTNIKSAVEMSRDVEMMREKIKEVYDRTPPEWNIPMEDLAAKTTRKYPLMPLPTSSAPPSAGLGGPGAAAPLLDVIKKYVADGAPTVKNYEKTAASPATLPKKYEPPKPTPHGIWRWFSDVFPEASLNIPNFLVPVFPREHWPEEVRWYIPDTLPNGGLWGWPADATQQLCFSLFSQGDRTLIHGPTGAGKSTLVMAVAHVLNIPVVRVNCHRDMQSTDFLGKDIIKSTPTGPVLEYDWSLTTLAAKHGGILLIDEAFRSPCLMSIQSLLERGGTLTLPDAASLKPAERRIVPPKDGFWITLTDNTVGVGDESGAYTAEVQDASTLDRITAVIHVPYMSVLAEERMLQRVFPEAPTKPITELATWADRIRAGFLNKTFQHSLSPRGTAAILRRFLATGNMAYAIRTAYLDKLTPPEKHAAKEAWYSVNGKELKL